VSHTHPLLWKVGEMNKTTTSVKKKNLQVGSNKSLRDVVIVETWERELLFATLCAPCNSFPSTILG